MHPLLSRPLNKILCEFVGEGVALNVGLECVVSFVEDLALEARDLVFGFAPDVFDGIVVRGVGGMWMRRSVRMSV